MSELLIIKIGGQVIDDAVARARFIEALASIEIPCLLVHGGGKLATKLSEKLGIETKMIEGRRITDAATLEIITQVYGGAINKGLVAELQAKRKNAIGLSGADGDLVRAKKREHASIDFGYVGDITTVNADAFDAFLQKNLLPVIAPITHDGAGQLLNTNADTMAQAIAVALSSRYKITLIFGFEKLGVLLNRADESTLISHIKQRDYKELKEKGIVSEGMIPKLDNAFKAIEAGVSRVIIGKADLLSDLLNGKTGTTLSND